MTTLSALAGRKVVFLAVTFSAYTFVLMYVFNALEYGRNKMYSLENSRTLNLQSIDITVRNTSRQSTPEGRIWNLSSTLSIPNFYKLKPHETLSVKLNVRHIPRNDSYFPKNNNELYKNITYFRSRLQGKDAERLKRTIEVFDFVMTSNKMDYMLYGGSLIGSYRHHGLVPWDDDVDVLVPLSAKRSIYHAFKDVGPEYVLNTDFVFSWKLFSPSAHPIRGYNWRWPYLDIFFYAENETHIWDVAPQYINSFVYPKNKVFPLRRRPFMDLPLLAPYNPRAVIDTNYDVRLCKSGTWIHKWERYGIESSVNCSELYFKFTFVWRTFENGGCNESLILNGKTISYFFNKGMRC